jgi:acetylornithine deacetylase/succinyl-diaminopimelate desuccinylase-like protein
VSLFAQQQDEVTTLLQQYVRIDTSNPPGHTTKAADFLAGVLQREGIAVTRYESEPGKAIVLARLKATVTPPAGRAVLLLHHMDVVPADRSQWKMDPLSGTIQGSDMWGRGSLDMKGQGVAQLVAFLMLKRQGVPLSRDVILLAETRRGSRRHDGRPLDDRESLRGAGSRIRDRRRRLREPRPCLPSTNSSTASRSPRRS